MANFILSPPPTLEPISIDGRYLTPTWKTWFNDIRAVIPEAFVSKQNVTAAGALDESAHYISLVNSTASTTYAVTLAAPTIPGITKVIEMITRTGTGDVTLALTNVEGGSAATTCTWNSVGDTLILISRSNKWIVLKEDGVALT